MKRITLALMGIAALALVAVAAACSSSDSQSQQAQSQESTSAGQAAQSDAQRQDQPQAAAPPDQQAEQQEQQSVTAAERGENQQQQAQSESDSGGSEDADPSTTDAQPQEQQQSAPAEQQDQAQPQAEQSDPQPSGEGEQDQPQPQQDEPIQQQEQPADQPESQPDDDQQPSESDDAPDQQQQAQPQADQADEPDEPAQQAAEPDAADAEQLRQRAEEISAQATVSDLVGINAWLNGEETSVALELAKGNIVLIDFWTYTCINCVRTLPFLTAWDAKYREHGLVIIGVHTPEFEFEERLENVRAANAEHGVEYLVAIDNDYATWRALQGRRGFWPRKFLIGPTPDGSPMGVRYDHIGEGDYEETELQIRAALEAVGRDLSDVPVGVDVAVPTRGATPGRQTRELYAGWSRNNGSGGPYAGQEAYFLAGPNVPTLYTDVELSDREHNLWYLQGLWETDAESIVHARETKGLEDYIALIIRGRTANVVLTVAEDGQPFNVFVELDGRWLSPIEAGSHVQWDDQGRSFIRVTENDLYRLVFLPDWSEHELKLRSDSDQFRIFAFTFGSYVGGE